MAVSRRRGNRVGFHEKTAPSSSPSSLNSEEGFVIQSLLPSCDHGAHDCDVALGSSPDIGVCDILCVYSSLACLCVQRVVTSG